MCSGWAIGFAAVKWLGELHRLDPEHPFVVSTAVSAAMTIGSAGLICALQPRLLRSQWASLSPPLDDAWRLFSRALSVAIMMLWTDTLATVLIDSVPQEQQQGPLYQRMLFSVALSLTAACSLVNVRVVGWRRRLLSDATKPAERALVHLALMTELTLGFVVGSFWTRFVVSITNLADYPTLAVTAKDALTAALLTGGAALWLVALGSRSSGQVRRPIHKS